MSLPTIYLLRHGETIWNVEGRYQGQLDSALTSKGEAQAQVNAKKLLNYLDPSQPFSFYASPLGRAKSTALIIAKHIGFDVSLIEFEERIKEVNYGIFEGQTKEHCKTVLKEQFEAREANKWDYVLEGGESYEMVTERLKDWLASLDRTQPIVMVAHEMINRALRGIYLNLEHDEMLKLRQPNDVLMVLHNGEEKILN